MKRSTAAALLLLLGCIPSTETPTPSISPARVAASAQTAEASGAPTSLASVLRWDRLSHDDPAVAYARQWLPVFEMMPTGPKSPFPQDATDEEIRSFAAYAEVLLSTYETLITSVGRLPEGELTDQQVRDAVDARAFPSMSGGRGGSSERARARRRSEPLR